MSSVKVELNIPKIVDKVTNDRFGTFLAKEWKRLINPFTPHRFGKLEETVTYRPFEIEYMQDYARYMYYGEVYVDPIFNASGFTNDGGITWRSRKNVKKIPSGRRFNYLADPNKHATDHWDQAAEQAGQKQKLIAAANLYLQNL